jgi:hypothetical protein
MLVKFLIVLAVIVTSSAFQQSPRLRSSIGASLKLPGIASRPAISHFVKVQSTVEEQGEIKNALIGAKLSEYSAMGTKKKMEWNPITQSFEYKSESELDLAHALHGHFFPAGELSEDYYRYARWRAAQRLVSAANSVFGAQALLLGLGMKKSNIGKAFLVSLHVSTLNMRNNLCCYLLFRLPFLGLAAATMWVLKDSLGKVSRIMWASANGRKFDADAKKWRFRSSLLYVAGNALEIVTYLFPSLYMAAAALAYAMKQMSITTAAATRNTM